MQNKPPPETSEEAEGEIYSKEPWACSKCTF